MLTIYMKYADVTQISTKIKLDP